MLTRFSNDRDPFADPPHTRQDLERLAADARARVPVPYPSTTTAGAGAGNDAKALVTLVPVAIHGLLVLGPAWSMISHGGADHSDTATESESLVSSVAGGGNSADALDRSRSSDPMDLLLPVVPSGLRFMTGAAILGLTLSWFDPLSAKAFGDSISIALALVVDDLLHDPRQISQKWTEFPIVAKSAVSEAFSIPHQYTRSNCPLQNTLW
ncbi:hypothetical protein BC828DRAFT_263051 [Blastocladiella britannica]|nr:hypothetical protein BC828DRAFT_263051 [Blastocladiella britannica]